MKLCCVNRAKWIITFQMIISIHEIIAQRENKPTLQDLLTLCNEYDVFNCQWLHQNALNDFIVTPKDVDDPKLIEYRNRLGPKQSDNVFQFPLARTWRGPSGQPAWNEADKIEFAVPLSSETKRDVHSFSNWGGKRGRMPRDDTPNGKRPTAFSNWGGKRTQKFFNWGGKRSVDTNQMGDQTSDNSEHNVMKRSIGDPSQQNNLPEKPTCVTNDRSPEEVIKDFINWSRKQPDHKKGSMNRKMFGISVLRGSDDLSRRADSFFQWGGKRNAKNN